MKSPAKFKQLFPLGRIFGTPGAIDAIADAGQTPLDFLIWHLVGDWGQLCEEDWRANDLAVVEGNRILSSYKTCKRVKLWAITEWDRSKTTLLLPADY